MILFVKSHAVPLLFMALIFILSSIPGDVEEGPFVVFNLVNPSFQNLMHIPLYGILQFLWLRSFSRHGKKGIVIVLICLGITIGYGIFDELHQIFTPGRYGSFLDMLLNFLGGCIGTGMFFMGHRFNRSGSDQPLRREE